MLAPPRFRRWSRLQVDMPVTIRFPGCVQMQMVLGRAIEMSEGGVAVCAGMELGQDELVEIHFQAPPRAQVMATIRYRIGYCFGLEFLTPLEPERQSVEMAAETAAAGGFGSDAFAEIRQRTGRSVEYLAGARALRLSGKREQAELAEGCALVGLLQINQERLRAKACNTRRMRDQITELRSIGKSLRAAVGKQIDSQALHIIGAAIKLLSQPPQQS